MGDPGRYPLDRLESFVTGLFVAAGARSGEAALTARVMLVADLRGRSGHGLRRVTPWVRRMLAGGINPSPDVTIARESPVSALVDGDNGLGPVVMSRATELAIDKATSQGMAWVGTRHSNHAGAAGIYPAMALDHGLIALYLAVGAFNSMPPWGGQEPILGTNPMAVGIPAGAEPSFQLDIATTTVSQGTIRIYAEAGNELPPGWVMGLDGQPITDPTRAGEGFLTPMGGHKGSGLATMIGLLAGVMNGAAFGRDVVNPSDPQHLPTNTGQSIFVMKSDLFRPKDEFLAEIDRHIRELRESQPIGDEPVRLPGELGDARERDRRRHGVPVAPPVIETLNDLARSLGVAPLD